MFFAMDSGDCGPKTFDDILSNLAPFFKLLIFDGQSVIMPARKKNWSLFQEKAAKARRVILDIRKQTKDQLEAQRLADRIISMLNFFRTGESDYCNHVRLGSSRFLAILQRRMTAEHTHGFGRIGHDFAQGSLWEDWARAGGSLPLFGRDPTPFTLTTEQSFHVSPNCPFIVASTDFAIKYNRPDGTPEEALVEIKTTNREINSKAFSSGRRHQQTYQLQVALQCSQMNVGWLVFIDTDGQNPQQRPNSEVRCFLVRRQDNFFQRHQAQLIAGYGHYLASCAAYPKPPSPELLKFTDGELHARKAELFLTERVREPSEALADTRYIAKGKRRCMINQAAQLQRVEAKGFKRERGRPKIPWVQRKWKKKSKWGA